MKEIEATAIEVPAGIVYWMLVYRYNHSADWSSNGIMSHDKAKVLEGKHDYYTECYLVKIVLPIKEISDERD